MYVNECIYTRCMYIVRVIKVIMPTEKKKRKKIRARCTYTHRGPPVMDVFVEPKGISDGIMYYTGPGTAADDKNTINVRAAMYTLDKPCPRITRRQLVPCSTLYIYIYNIDRRPFVYYVVRYNIIRIIKCVAYVYNIWWQGMATTTMRTFV